jgi:hypothetical protein
MERRSNPVWQQCLRTIEPVLESLGFKLTNEAQYHTLFGSASAEYERVGMRIELFWDGKENWIDAHYFESDRTDRHVWSERQRLEVEPPPTNVRAHVLRPGTIADEYIANLVTAVRALATGPRSIS